MGKIVFQLKFKAVSPWGSAVVFSGGICVNNVVAEAQGVGKTCVQAAEARINLYSNRKAYMQLAGLFLCTPGNIPDIIISNIKACLLYRVYID